MKLIKSMKDSEMQSVESIASIHSYDADQM